MSDYRCLASAEVVPGVMKRCIRGVGHPDSELHLWVEATSVASGVPILVEWDAEKQIQTFELSAKGTPEQ